MEEMPPGFRFFPTEEELVCFYLHNKLEGTRQDVDRLMNRVIPVLDIYDFNPWDLPQLSGERCQRDPEQWLFFIPRQEREARGGRTNRLTNSGYWKATGSPGCVFSSANHVIGVKKTMVFYEGRAPRGRKTKWKMNEYKAIERETYNPSTGAIPMLRQEFSLCRVYLKSKCLRAFDRRPSEVVIHEARAQQAHGDEATISHHENHPTVEKTSLPESSSPGDHGDHPSQTGKSSTNWEMYVDNEPLWEWEQLNWI